MPEEEAAKKLTGEQGNATKQTRSNDRG